jgi:hypothetical protein
MGMSGHLRTLFCTQGKSPWYPADNLGEPKASLDIVRIFRIVLIFGVNIWCIYGFFSFFDLEEGQISAFLLTMPICDA